MWNICPVLFTMILSLCLSPIPSMYVATQYPAHDSVKFSTAYNINDWEWVKNNYIGVVYSLNLNVNERTTQNYSGQIVKHTFTCNLYGTNYGTSYNSITSHIVYWFLPLTSVWTSSTIEWYGLVWNNGIWNNGIMEWYGYNMKIARILPCYSQNL